MQADSLIYQASCGVDHEPLSNSLRTERALAMGPEILLDSQLCSS